MFWIVNYLFFTAGNYCIELCHIPMFESFFRIYYIMIFVIWFFYFYASDLGDIVLTHCSLVYFLGCQYCYTKYKRLKSLFWKLRVKNIFLIVSSMSESNTAISERNRISQTRLKKTGLTKVKDQTLLSSAWHYSTLAYNIFRTQKIMNNKKVHP